MADGNQYVTTFSNDEDFDLAAESAVNQLMDQLGPEPDIVFLFSCAHPQEKTERFAEHLGKLAPKHVIGSNCMGLVSGRQEYFDGNPALSVWGAKLGTARVDSFRLQYERTSDGGVFIGWPEDTSFLNESSTLIGVADPYSFPMDILLHQLNEDRPGVQFVGGMSSGSARPGDWNLYHGDSIFHDGASVIAITGDNCVKPMVSQACRPIGDPMIVTACERNIIQTLGGKPAVEQLFTMFDALPVNEQKKVNNGLHVGLAVTEYKDQFGYGDFLIRNVMGFDRQTGAITIGDFVRVGVTVQFHVRDDETAAIDLKEECVNAKKDPNFSPRSALVFSCNGRGPNMFDTKNHDANLICDELGIESLAGFFVAGEVGPVGNKNFLHGFTASVAIFQ